MKKAKLLILALLSCGSAYALPVGNPVMPMLLTEGIIKCGHHADLRDPCTTMWDSWSMRVGFYGDYVFNRNVEHSNDSVKDANIEKLTLSSNAAEFTFNLYDRCDFFGVVGTTKMRLYSALSAFVEQDEQLLVLDTNSAGMWSVGARSILWDCGCLFVGGSVQYMYTVPKANFLIASKWAPLQDQLEIKYGEWQVDLAASYRIESWIPYVGVKFARCHGNMDNTVINPVKTDIFFGKLKETKRWGYALGLTMVRCDMMELTGEARFGDEAGFHVTSTLRY